MAFLCNHDEPITKTRPRKFVLRDSLCGAASPCLSVQLYLRLLIVRIWIAGRFPGEQVVADDSGNHRDVDVTDFHFRDPANPMKNTESEPAFWVQSSQIH